MRNIIFTARNTTKAHIALADRGIDEAALALGAPPYKSELFALHALDNNVLIGLLNGKIFWDWLYIDTLWVQSEYERHGIGTELMRRAEDNARAENLTGILLWTQDWQAEEFYQKFNYEVFTRLDNFPRGHQRIGLRKYLN